MRIGIAVSRLGVRVDRFIVDASVAVKWYFDEEGKESAIHLANQLKSNKIKLIVPEIFFAEFANVCWTKVRKRIIKSTDALEILDDLAKLPLQRYSDWELSDVALENALQYGLTVYDALYIALAEIYCAPLVTADTIIVDACKGRFDFLLPLSEFK